LEYKEKYVSELLRPYVKLSGIVGMDDPYHYRNKVNAAFAHVKDGRRERNVSGIYEQGTPAELFDQPKKPLTVSFIHKIKYFTYEITRRDFDLMQLQGGIQQFGEKYGLSSKQTNRLQVCCEELIYELLEHSCPPGSEVELKLSVSYAEADKASQIALSCRGTDYNPFAQEEDSLGVTILRRMGRQVGYRRDGGCSFIDVSL
jgi:polar amino acid transport system ATP-binding protein